MVLTDTGQQSGVEDNNTHYFVMLADSRPPVRMSIATVQGLFNEAFVNELRNKTIPNYRQCGKLEIPLRVWAAFKILLLRLCYNKHGNHC